MNDRSCFNVCGCSISNIAFVFFSNGIIPFGLILYQSYVISVWANSQLFRLMAKVSLSNLDRTLFISSSWLFIDPLVIIIMSSGNAYAELMLFNV